MYTKSHKSTHRNTLHRVHTENINPWDAETRITGDKQVDIMTAGALALTSPTDT